MSNNKHQGGWLIITTLLLAMVMSLFPMPDSWQAWRPSWLMLVLSFWVIALPDRVGLLWALVCGLLMDVLLNTSLGLHGFALAITTFMLQILYKRIRLFPYWKQGLSVAAISSVYIAITFWLTKLTGKSQESIAWQAILLNGILWPWLNMILKQLSAYFRVR
ncbi:MAG: rod shape-determining protein MreD [Gammaproteobacteria bacterium]|nr:rod shape-determining protein MreD [Gammaproteobacteria bacterium]